MNSKATSVPTFSSDGFDLDAATGSEDVILEVGGGSSKVEVTNEENKSLEDQPPTSVSAIAKSEEFKELGNSLLGNFGLSMDNFQAVKGPDGGYSISFNQNK